MSLVKKKEDSNYMLSKDLLEDMTQFNREKAALDRRMLQRIVTYF